MGEDESEKDYEPVDDRNVYWHPREPIEHTFASPPTPANSFLALIFTFIILAPLGGFFMLREQFVGRVTFKISMLGYGFQLSMLATILLIAGYWLALNLMQTMN